MPIFHRRKMDADYVREEGEKKRGTFVQSVLDIDKDRE